MEIMDMLCLKRYKPRLLNLETKKITVTLSSSSQKRWNYY